MPYDTSSDGRRFTPETNGGPQPARHTVFGAAPGLHTKPDYVIQKGDLVLLFPDSNAKAAFLEKPSVQGRIGTRKVPFYVAKDVAGQALGSRRIAVALFSDSDDYEDDGYSDDGGGADVRDDTNEPY